MEKKNKTNAYLAKHYKQLWFVILLSVILTAGFQLLSYLPFIQDIEDKALDYKFKLTPIPARADTNIVLLAIDAGTLKYAQQFKQGWPFPREFYALVTEYLSRQGAKSIIFDMQFYEPDFDRADINSEESDMNFADAMQKSGNVVIGTQFVPDATSIPEDLSKQTLSVSNVNMLRLPYWQGVEAPIPMFLSSAGRIGIINVYEDREAIVRRMPLIYNLQNKHYPNLAFSSWLLTHNIKTDFTVEGHNLITGKTKIPLDKNGNLNLNWYGKGDVDGVFKYFSFASALQSAVATIYQTGKPTLRDGLFKDKYVIIGAKAAGLMDLKSTPYTWSVPGMEIWATILSNLNKQDFVHEASILVNLLLSFLLIFLTILMVTRLNSAVSTGLLIIMIILMLTGRVLLFGLFRFDVQVTIPFIAIIVTWILMVTISYVMEGRHKKELRMIFTRYLHPDLVKKIVDQPDMVHMGGEEYKATVMFSDIYNFTGFSENKTPTELVSYLNEYFSTFTNTILDFEGLLDKYTGDGLMAVFGVPIARDDHALLACKTALAHRDFSNALKSKSELSPSDHFHINTRLGIHSGVLVAGNIGSERRMEYTSIGDTVNLSARLEGVNKVFHTHIIISEGTYLLVKDAMVCRELDFLRVKGKKEPTRIYELVAEMENVPGTILLPEEDSRLRRNDDKYSWIALYEEALKHYRTGNWQPASELFETLSKEPYNDPASPTMLARCRHLIANPPETWDGIYTLEEK